MFGAEIEHGGAVRGGEHVRRTGDLHRDALTLLVALFIAWRHWLGMLDKLKNGETTFLLGMPLWWVYASGLLGAAAFVVVALYCAGRSAANLLSPNPARPISGMVE